MADNPAEYIAELQVEVRTSRAALSLAQRKIEELELALAHSDAIRAALVEASSDACKNLVVALERLEQYQPIVDAAVSYYEIDGRGSTHRELCEAVEPEIERREARS